MSVPLGVLIPVVVAGIALAALFSAAETALVRVTRTAVSSLVAEGNRRAALVERLTSQRRANATRISFLRLLAEMTSATAITIMVAAAMSTWWHVLLVSLAISVLVALVVVRISPRSIGRRHPLTVLRVLAPIINAGLVITKPFARYVAATGTQDSADDDFTPEEIRDLVERVAQSQTVEEEDGELIRSAFEIGDTYTREVMVPRTAMITIAADTSLPKAMNLFMRSGYSRLPVTGIDVDDLRGVLYFKDLVAYQRNNPDSDATAGDIARPATFVPESKLVDDLLRDMQANATHIAIVVDEYGGIAGLATMEDALEEIVGELTDEHDRGEQQIEDLGDGSFRVPARLPVDELGELFDLDIEDEDVDSAGGLLAKALGKVPIAGAQAEALGLHLAADRFEGRRRQLETLIVRRSAEVA